jgi:methylthioribose-1-phosphate isomerase
VNDPDRTILQRDELRPFRLEPRVLRLLDQRALPHEERWLSLEDVEGVAAAIETLAVRGAPAIGGAAALGVALAARTATTTDGAALRRALIAASARLRTTRPTAVNLFYALDRMDRAIAAGGDDVAGLRAAVVDEAERVVLEDEAACARMGEAGASLLQDGDVVLTICHTGALATCGQGTALGAVKSARRAGKRVSVVALETRPLLQGARLTAWECLREGIPVTLITDGMAAAAFSRKGITKAFAGADRIAANGDSANKIGTYGVAVLARFHGVPFSIVAPTTTIDARTADGAGIVVEERAADEVRRPQGAVFAPADAPVWNPAFDVTPAALIDAIATDAGVLRAPYGPAIAGASRR